MEDADWDTDKARANLAKHGVSFDDAATVFNDPHGVDWPDDEHSGREERWIRIGVDLHGRMLHVVVAGAPGGKMRIISARRATKRERHAYEDV